MAREREGPERGGYLPVLDQACTAAAAEGVAAAHSAWVVQQPQAERALELRLLQ